MLTTIMAAFAFGYCVMDIIMNYHNHRETQKALRETIEVSR
jgi:hypothetical protein